MRRLTTEEAATLAEVTPRTIRRWAEAGLIRREYRGRRAYYSAADVRKVIRYRERYER